MIRVPHPHQRLQLRKSVPDALVGVYLADDCKPCMVSTTLACMCKDLAGASLQYCSCNNYELFMEVIFTMSSGVGSVWGGAGPVLRPPPQ